VAEQLRRTVPGGIGVYVGGLLQGLTELGHDGLDVPDVTLYASRARRSPDPLGSFGERVTASRLPSAVLTRAWDRSILHAPEGFGVVHATSLAVPPVRRGATVVTVHDVAWRHVPDAYPRRGRRWHEAALQRALHRASHLVVPSAGVADDLIAAGAPASAITVVPHGADHLPEPDDVNATALLERFAVTGEFVLSVGTVEPRKNLRRVFEAYGVARSSLPGPWPLVVVGPSGWGPGMASHPGVVLTGAVSPEVLAGLYARARLLVYVPLVEGFGLPPVEAMRLGTPVVASRLPSTGGAALEVDPSSAEAIGAAIVRVATDDDLRRDLGVRGAAHARSLTWRAAAGAHIHLWNSVR
jgi:glycosyltransferase involved in cell wall biosynthesis